MLSFVWLARLALPLGAALVLALGVAGCEDTELAPTDMDQVPPRVTDTEAGEGKGEGEGEEQEQGAAPTQKAEIVFEYEDEDFVEIDIEHRDPFRSFVTYFNVRVAAPAQRRVLMSDTSVDDMRLIAIVTGIPQPRAMFTDAGNVGHVVKRGDYIGRPEVIEAGGGDSMPITLNWRVERIRDAELVLTREDPVASDEPPLTRVVPLHDRDEE